MISVTACTKRFWPSAGSVKRPVLFSIRELPLNLIAHCREPDAISTGRFNRHWEDNMNFARVVAWLVTIFLCGIGLILLIKPEVATGPHGLPLLRGESRPMMAVLAAREIVLGLLAGGLAWTGNFRGLLLAFAIALLITIIDAVALFITGSVFGFVVN